MNPEILEDFFSLWGASGKLNPEGAINL